MKLVSWIALTAVPSEHWYRYQGRPLVVFYNAGTLKPENKSAATLVRLKELFRAEFGEEPFLAIDRAFQDPATQSIADAEFRWNTIQAGDLSRSEVKGVTFDHFMAKWDPVGRENNGRPPISSSRGRSSSTSAWRPRPART